ncbi:thioredoxin domain-containing protein [Candidatus Dojkabacteria bacterium]|nr:thioredoxin domain-containing protein [Candidatus Dojkabacteria bacterium]
MTHCSCETIISKFREILNYIFYICLMAQGDIKTAKTKKSSRKKSGENTSRSKTNKSTASKKKPTSKREKTKGKSVVKSSVGSQKRKKKNDENVKEIKIESLDKLYLPVAIIIAGIFVGCGLFFGLSYGGGFGGGKDYQCNSFEPLSRDCLLKKAQESDLKVSKFKKCIDDQEYYDTIKSSVDSLNEIGIQGTPQVVIGEMQDGKVRGFYAGGAQGYDYYEDLIEKVKEDGLEKAHENFISENLGTLPELTKRYEEAYKEQAKSSDQAVSDEEVKDLAKTSAESQYETLAIKDYEVDNSFQVGDSDADIVLLEYSDFSCSYCKTFANDTLPELKEKFIDSGEVLFVYKSLPLEETPGKGYRAANAVKCAADQDKFFKYHNLLFEVEE